MQKFLVVYLAPYEGLQEWMQTDPGIREPEEAKMQAQWNAWMKQHPEVEASQTAGIGKTKRITKEGITDAHNNMMLYSVIEAESHDAAAELFKDNPHFGIPNASIEIMPINFLPGMEG